MNRLDDGPRYDEYYFQHGCGLPYERNEHWLRFFGQIAERIVRGIGPRTVLDAGCAMGFLVEALRERGVEAYGVDTSEYALAHVADSIRPYCWQGSVLDLFPRRYDLVVCMEVVEHLPPGEGERALANLCQAADDIIFSSSPSDFREPTHFNVQPPEHWAERFAEQGFVRDVDFDLVVIAPWAMRLRRSQEPLPRLVAAYERRFWQLCLENSELRQANAAVRELERRSADQDRELQSIKTSGRWRTAQSIGMWRDRLAPVGSRRERLLALGGRLLTRRSGDPRPNSS